MITGETMKINLNSEDSKVVKQNETYTLIDNTNLNGLVVSKTILHPEKHTTGHWSRWCDIDTWWRFSQSMELK